VVSVEPTDVDAGFRHVSKNDLAQTRKTASVASSNLAQHALGNLLCKCAKASRKVALQLRNSVQCCLRGKGLRPEIRQVDSKGSDPLCWEADESLRVRRE
jgi:hypothetical protein